MFENQERLVLRNFTTNVPKILDLKSSSGQIFPKIDVECPRVNSLSFCEGSQRVKLSFNGWPANKQEGGGGGGRNSILICRLVHVKCPSFQPLLI